MGIVHFWTAAPGSASEWRPDEEPELHASAYGHAFLELHWRLHALGYPVSIGPVAPANAEVLVVLLHEIFDWQRGTVTRPTLRLALQSLFRRRPPKIVVIRVDLPLRVAAPRIASLTIMPTRASIELPDQAWVPMLPNRGLIPRDESRGAELVTVALKAYSYNVPTWIDDDFRQELRSLGFELRIDTEAGGRWRDFHDIDIVLCAQDESTLEDERRKPATKLINAWRAGSIPVCGPYSAYQELGLAGETMLLCDGTARGYLDALGSLRHNPELASRIRSHLPAQARDYAPDRVVRLWWATFSAAPRTTRRQLANGAILLWWALLMRKLGRGRSSEIAAHSPR